MRPLSDLEAVIEQEGAREAFRGSAAGVARLKV
jgi:hypothetical protein